MPTLKPVVVDTRQCDEFASATSELATAEGIEALCGIPLVNHGRVIGILSSLGLDSGQVDSCLRPSCFRRSGRARAVPGHIDERR